MKFKSLLCLPGYTKKLFIDESSTKSVLLQVLAGAIEVCLVKLGQKACFKVFSKVQLLKITSLLNLKKLQVQTWKKVLFEGSLQKCIQFKTFYTSMRYGAPWDGSRLSGISSVNYYLQVLIFTEPP